MTVKPLVVRPRDAMQMLGVSKSTIFTMMSDGRLDRRKLGERAVGITIASVERLLQQGARPSKAAPRASRDDAAAVCAKEL